MPGFAALGADGSASLVLKSQTDNSVGMLLLWEKLFISWHKSHTPSVLHTGGRHEGVILLDPLCAGGLVPLAAAG